MSNEDDEGRRVIVSVCRDDQPPSLVMGKETYMSTRKSEPEQKAIVLKMNIGRWEKYPTTDRAKVAIIPVIAGFWLIG